MDPKYEWYFVITSFPSLWPGITRMLEKRKDCIFLTVINRGGTKNLGDTSAIHCETLPPRSHDGSDIYLCIANCLLFTNYLAE